MLQWNKYNYLGLRGTFHKPLKHTVRRPWSSDKAQNIFNMLKQIFRCLQYCPTNMHICLISHTIFQNSTLVLDRLTLLFFNLEQAFQVIQLTFFIRQMRKMKCRQLSGFLKVIKQVRGRGRIRVGGLPSRPLTHQSSLPSWPP